MQILKTSLVFTPKSWGTRFGTGPLPPTKSLDMLIEQFLASLHFQQRRKLDQSGIEIGSIDENSFNFGSSP
jgi:hypothetical protein